MMDIIFNGHRPLPNHDLNDGVWYSNYTIPRQSTTHTYWHILTTGDNYSRARYNSNSFSKLSTITFLHTLLYQTSIRIKVRLNTLVVLIGQTRPMDGVALTLVVFEESFYYIQR
jgi:hypothetical protein